MSQSSGLKVITEEQSSPPTVSSSTVRMVTAKQGAEECQKDSIKCICKQNDEVLKAKIASSDVEDILREKEKELREKYEKILEREKELIKDRFNIILSNEQTRASYMLREAHRERQEKIHALRTQLQCKNLAALMYVMCTERRRSRIEKLKIVEDYTNYINVLHDILSRGQELILHLSRGYKTAAKVDHEWREKMKRVVSEFMAFIYHFAGGDPETNQYLIDLPKLLTTKAPTEINPEEDPCDCYDDEEDTKESVEDKAIKDMYYKSNCNHLDKIKNVYPDKLPVAVKWECTHSPPDGDFRTNSKTSIAPYNRQASIDYRGNMGSMLKIITSGPSTAPVPAKTEILGARDSIEITSATKLSSAFVDIEHEEVERKTTPPLSAPLSPHQDDQVDESISILGSIHNDSLQVLQLRNPEQDHKINYERACPIAKCQRMQVDSFMRTLPPYMRANPFTHFEQTFDQYETCTPEQLKMLQERIEQKMHKKSVEIEADSGTQSPLSEWLSTGVGVQTSDLDLLPPCTCQPDAPERSQSSSSFIFKLADLENVKVAMDAVHRECLFDDRIEFDRFKLIGQEIDSRNQKKAQQAADFKQSRYEEISKILEKHPSLLDIFQANAK